MLVEMASALSCLLLMILRLGFVSPTSAGVAITSVKEKALRPRPLSCDAALLPESVRKGVRMLMLDITAR